MLFPAPPNSTDLNDQQLEGYLDVVIGSMRHLPYRVDVPSATFWNSYLPVSGHN